MVQETLVMLSAFDLDEVGQLSPAFSPHMMSCEEQAKLIAVDLAVLYYGVVAWTRKLDPKTRRYGDPVELVRYGIAPSVH